jgi:hypothetical protein
MSTKHSTNILCPICRETYAEHVHCANLGCTFHVTACPKCDANQRVEAFIADHAKDCPHEATAPFVRQRHVA